MSSRIRKPETVRLNISRGDWLIVKKYLTAGEHRAYLKRMIRDGVTGDQIDSVRVGLSKMISYLVDWSITDADDKPVVIRDQSEDVIGSAVDELDVESFKEILRAIEQHEDDMAEALKAEQARPTIEIASSAISTSLVG